MDDRERSLEWTKPVGIPDEQPKARKNVTQGCFYREIGCYKNTVPSEFQWFAEDRLVDKITYEELKCQLPDSPRSTFLMVFSPDGKKVASTHGNHNVYVTDLTTGKNIQTLSGHPRTPWCIAFHPSSNQILASGCLAGQVRVWDLHGGSEVWTAESQSVIASLAFHPIDRMLVIATYNELHFWDWSQSKPFAKCSTKSEREKVRYVSFDRLGNKLITGIANPVNIPSQWDRVSVINTQSVITTSATTSTTTSSSTMMTTSSNSNQGRSITFCDGYLMNQYSQLVRRYIDLSRSRRTPTIDRGTDPMDLVEVQNIHSQTEGTRQCSAQCQNNSNRSNIRYRIMRSACRAYRPPSSRERFRIHSSLLSGLPSRPSSSSNSLVRMTTTATTVTTTTTTNQNSTCAPTVTTSGSFPVPSQLSRIRPCGFSLVSGRPVCLTFSRENSSNLFSMRPSLPATHSGAVTHPTYTSYSERSIFSTRETNSGEVDRSRIPVIRPYRIVFDDINHFRASVHTVIRPSSEDSVNRNAQELRINAISPLDRRDRLRSHLLDVEEVENDRDLQRSIAYVSPFRRLSSDSESTSTTPTNSQRPSPQQWVSHNTNHYPLHPRPVPRFQMRPSFDLNNSSPSRRSREDTDSESSSNTTPSMEASSLEATTSHSMSPVQINSGPVPRLQLRPRYLHDQQAQLRLITNTESHCSNSCQNLRRQFVLSRHSNSPFQPRVPHRIDHPVAVNCVAVTSHNISPSRPEIPSCMSSFVASGASSMTRSTPSVSVPVGNVASSTSNATNTATTTIAGDDSFVRGTREMRQRLYFFDQVKILLRDRIRNSSEHASTDSTVNYSNIANESEGESRNIMENSLEDGNRSNGLGPRGLDPMLSSVSENADNTNDTPLFPGTSTQPEVNGESSSNVENDANASQLEFTDPWDSDADTEPFPTSSPITSVEETGEQQESRRQIMRSEREAEVADSNFINQNRQALQSNIRGFIRSIDLNLSELSVREKIEILSQHIENMQKLCRARIEIIHLQQIKKMWEELTLQIRALRTTVHTSRNSGQSSEDNENSSSSRDPVNPSVSHLMRLAISDTSPVPEASNNAAQSTSSENSNENTFYSNFKELVDSMVNAILDDVDDDNTNNNSNTKRNIDKSKSDNSMLTASSTSRDENEDRECETARNETEEPQPGPSGLSGNSVCTRSSFRSRMYKSLRDILNKKRSNDIAASNSQAMHNQTELGESECDKSQDCSHSRNSLDSSSSRPTSREFCCGIESVIQDLKQSINEQGMNAANPGSSASSSSSSSSLVRAAIPSTSTEAVTIDPGTSTEVRASNEDASNAEGATVCQSCGLKKKTSKDQSKQKRRNSEISSESESNGSSSKIMKTNVGGRSVPSTNDDANAETASPGCSDQSNSTSELLRKMIGRMETMVQFQREVSRRTEELSENRLRLSGSPSVVRSSDDSDSDNTTVDRPSSAYLKNLVKSYRVTRKDILSLSRTVTQLRAKRLLDYMVRSLTEFFEENTSNPNRVSDDQIISLYTLLHLALELTDLLLDQLSFTSRDLGRVWRRENTTNNSTEPREPECFFSDRSRFIRRLRERNRGLTRSSYHSTFGPGREETVTRRIYPNPFLRSFPRAGPSRLCPHSSRPTSGCTGTTTTSTVFCRYRPSSTLVPGYRRCRRVPPRMSTTLPSNCSENDSARRSTDVPRWTCKMTRQGQGNVILPSRIGGGDASNSQTTSRLWDRGSSSQTELNANRCSRSDSNNNNVNNNNSNNNNNINNSNNNNNINNNVNNTSFSTSSASNNVNSNNNITVISGTTQSAGNLPPPPYLNLREQRPMFWIRYGSNNDSSSSTTNEVPSRENNFTVPVVQVNDVPVPDVSVLNPPRYRPQSPTPRVPEDLWRWRAWRPRFLHPRYIGPHPFDDQESNDMTDSIHYYRTGPNPGLYTLDPVIITDAPMSPHHRIQAWDFSKMNIPDISDREKNGVVAECKIHNDASVDVSNDGHLLVTLLPSGRLSVTTMLGVYSLDWNSLGQLLYKTSFEQNAVSVSLSPTNRHLLVGLASRPLVVRDRTNMAQIFRLEGARPTPPGGTWQSGRGRLILMRDLRQTRETNVMSLNCIRWAPGAGQGLVYGTNTGQLKVLR